MQYTHRITLAGVTGGWIRSAVDHGMADLHPSRELVEDETPDLALENCDQVGVGREFLVGSKDACREVPFEPVRDS